MNKRGKKAIQEIKKKKNGGGWITRSEKLGISVRTEMVEGGATRREGSQLERGGPMGVKGYMGNFLASKGRGLIWGRSRTKGSHALRGSNYLGSKMF